MSEKEQNSKELYDMSEHFKQVLDSKDDEMKSLKRQNIQLKKIIMMAYTGLRIIDEIMNTGMIALPDDLMNITNIAEIYRSQFSELVDEHVLNIEEE